MVTVDEIGYNFITCNGIKDENNSYKMYGYPFDAWSWTLAAITIATIAVLNVLAYRWLVSPLAPHHVGGLLQKLCLRSFEACFASLVNIGANDSVFQLTSKLNISSRKVFQLPLGIFALMGIVFTNAYSGIITTYSTVPFQKETPWHNISEMVGFYFITPPGFLNDRIYKQQDIQTGRRLHTFQLENMFTHYRICGNGNETHPFYKIKERSGSCPDDVWYPVTGRTIFENRQAVFLSSPSIEHGVNPGDYKRSHFSRFTHNILIEIGYEGYEDLYEDLRGCRRHGYLEQNHTLDKIIEFIKFRSGETVNVMKGKENLFLAATGFVFRGWAAKVLHKQMEEWMAFGLYRIWEKWHQILHHEAAWLRRIRAARIQSGIRDGPTPLNLNSKVVTCFILLTYAYTISVAIGFIEFTVANRLRIVALVFNLPSFLIKNVYLFSIKNKLRVMKNMD